MALTHSPVVAIDGPSGAGKGTVSRLLASQLRWHLLDSGALYRLVALAGQRQRLADGDVAGHARLASTMNVHFGSTEDGAERVVLEGNDVADQLRTEAAGAGASRVAAWSEVRQALMARQRAFAAPPGLVADGRDMGTVVFPDAPLKVYLTATPEERALRRYKQLKEKGSAVNLAALSRDITERDRQDSTRPVAPLIPAADAFVLDSTRQSATDVVATIWKLGAERGLWAAVPGKP